jgi:uncharacterized protein with von Willebrand factor type A (vWA) domain
MSVRPTDMAAFRPEDAPLTRTLQLEHMRKLLASIAVFERGDHGPLSGAERTRLRAERRRLQIDVRKLERRERAGKL